MGMVVRTNTMALNAYRQLGLNNSAVSKSLEKLASGYRINRAGDDAAGLAISEKMKAQITGLETASANAQDGISLIQTAEGNLSEVHDMLNRMVELSTKSANGTYTSTERQALQDEMDQLLDEIDRISQSANFNGTKLLNGTMGLNNEALSIGSSFDATSAGEVTIVSGVSVADDHVSPDATEVKPKFTVDFSEYKATVEKGAAAGTGTFTFTANSAKVQYYDAASSQWKDVSKEVTSTANNSTDAGKGDLAGAFTQGNLYKIGNDIYTAKTVNTTTGKVEFEYAGTELDAADPTKIAAGKDKVTATTWTPSGAFTVNATGDATVDASVRADCDITKVDDPVSGGESKRAGASLTLTADMIGDGKKLKIGNTTFEFSTSKTQTTAGTYNDSVVINIKDVDPNKLLQHVTEQMSNFTVKLERDHDKDGTATAREFAINRASNDTIHIDEIPGAGTTADPAHLGFTKAELEGAFKKVTDASNALTELTLKDNAKLADSESFMIGDTEIKFNKDDTAAATLANMKTAVEDAGYGARIDGNKLVILAPNAKPNDIPVIAGKGLTLQIGDTADPYNKMTVAVKDMSARGLGLDHLKGTGIMTENKASDAIDKIKTAINTVSTTRAGMGALQNRLEHTINNLDVAAENLSAANSRIRDTDMAKEMMNYTKMNVLVQSAQAMLAQANQQPQSVLQLLQ